MHSVVVSLYQAHKTAASGIRLWCRSDRYFHGGGAKIFRKKMVCPDRYSRNFGPPDQFFRRTQISVTREGGGGITLLSFTLPKKALHYSSRKKKTCSYTAQATAAVEDRCHSIFPPPDIFSSGANGLRIWPPPPDLWHYRTETPPLG